MYKSGNENHRNFYQKIDDSIMVGANKAVKAWNWTTGKTKADLANTMVVGSLIAQAIGIYINGEISVAALAIPYLLIHIEQPKFNLHMQELEIKAAENSMFNITVEEYKKFYSYMGPTVSTVGGSMALLGWRYEKPGIEMMCLGLAFLFGPSHYVMRADYLPPKKNALARGWIKAKELLRRQELKPVPVNCSSTLRI